MVSRRLVLGWMLASVAASACLRAAPRDEPAPGPTSTPDTDSWQASARSMLADALATLRTFDTFAAYRASVTPASGLRTPSILAWDPPTGATWDAATHVSRGLHDRANQLFLAISAATVDPALWRTQRETADAAHDLIDLGDALQAYRDRIDWLPPGDTSGALDLLDRAWARWDGAAMRWGMSRGEPVLCQG